MQIFATLCLLLFQAPPLPTKPGVLISDAELQHLPMSGAAWSDLRSDADRSLSGMTLGNQDEKLDSYTLAAALAYRRLHLAGQASLAEGYRSKVQAALLAAIQNTQDDGTSLPWSRNVCAVVIAADLIDWQPASSEDAFKAWARAVLTRTSSDGRSIVSTHEDRPNNWGTHAGASRAAIARYLGDAQELARCAQVFQGWLGDRSRYAGFDYGDLSWQSDPSRPVGINPSGGILGSVIPDDQRRCGSYPADYGCQSNYTYEALQGVIAQAIILRRGGYPTWACSRGAIGRAVYWLTTTNNQPPTAAVNGSDDRWQAYVLVKVYPRLAPILTLASPAPPGKALGYCDYLTSGGTWP